MFLCKGISESASREAEKKREKLLQLSMRVSTARYSAIKGAVSADGDGKRSSGVDDLARNEPPSQVLAVGGWVRHMPKDGLSWWERVERRQCLEPG